MIKTLIRLRNYLISGLLFWIPLILSIIVIKFFLEFINNLVPQRYLPEAIFNLDNATEVLAADPPRCVEKF